MKSVMLWYVGVTLICLTKLSAHVIYDIQTYGAVGDGKTDDAPAIQKAIDSCSAAGGGVVLLPAPHTFLSGPFVLKSNLDFLVENGATLLANPDENVYTKSAFRENPGEGTLWISGENVEHITLIGSGTIDGNGVSFMGKELGDSYELKPFTIKDPRPHLLTIVGGQHIRIHDLVIRNSAYWTIYSFYLDQARRVEMNNSSVRWGEKKPPYFRYVFESHGVEALEVFHLSGEAAFPDQFERTEED